MHAETALWVFTPSAIRALAEQNGYVKVLEDAGAKLMSDTCPAIGQFLPEGGAGDRDRLRQAGALPAGDHERAGLVRRHARMRRGGAHRPVEWRACVSELVLHGRKVVGGVAEGEALVTQQAISGWGRTLTS